MILIKFQRNGQPQISDTFYNNALKKVDIHHYVIKL